MKKKFFYFAITMATACAIAFCSCSQKCTQSPQAEYWKLKGIEKD